MNYLIKKKLNSVFGLDKSKKIIGCWKKYWKIAAGAVLVLCAATFVRNKVAVSNSQQEQQIVERGGHAEEWDEQEIDQQIRESVINTLKEEVISDLAASEWSHRSWAEKYYFLKSNPQAFESYERIVKDSNEKKALFLTLCHYYYTVTLPAEARKHGDNILRYRYIKCIEEKEQTLADCVSRCSYVAYHGLEEEIQIHVEGRLTMWYWESVQSKQAAKFLQDGCGYDYAQVLFCFLSSDFYDNFCEDNSKRLGYEWEEDYEVCGGPIGHMLGHYGSDGFCREELKGISYDDLVECCLTYYRYLNR